MQHCSLLWYQIFLKFLEIFKRKQVLVKLAIIRIVVISIISQNQFQVKLFAYSKQIQFLRKIILKGDFQQTIEFLNTLQTHIGDKNYKNSCMNVYKQKLYQLINIPNEKQLKQLFEIQIVNHCTQQQFQHFFTLLTYRKTYQIQGLNDWTVMKGRLRLFQQLLPIIEPVLCNARINIQKNEKQQILNLDQVVALYIQSSTNVKNNESQGNEIKIVSKNISSMQKSKLKTENQLEMNEKKNKKSSQQEIILNQFQPQSNISEIDKKSTLYSNQISYKRQNQNKPLYSKDNKSQIRQNRSNLPQSQINLSRSQFSGSKLYQEEQINQISEQQQKSDTVKEGGNDNNNNSKVRSSNRGSQIYKNKYVEPSQSEGMQQSSRHNIEYLQQTNSVVYNNDLERDHQNFTFSHHNLTYDTEKPRKINKLATISDNKAIRTCQFSSSGQYFAVGTNSSILKIFQVQELFSENKFKDIKPIYQINGLHSKSIFCLDWSKDQKSMVTCSNDLTIKLTQFKSKFSSHEVSVIGRHESCIRMVKYNQQQSKIYSCGDDSLIKVWDMGKIKRCYNLKGHTAGISAFKISQRQNQIYSVSKDSTIKKWDLRTLTCVATSKSQESQMTFIANNSLKIVASNRNGNVLFFDQQLVLEYETKIHEEQIRSISASKSQGLFLTASFDGHVAMFSQKTIHSPDYFQHNQNSEDKVVFATFLQHSQFRGFSSTSTLGLCHIYSYS